MNRDNSCTCTVDLLTYLFAYIRQHKIHNLWSLPRFEYVSYFSETQPHEGVYVLSPRSPFIIHGCYYAKQQTKNKRETQNQRKRVEGERATGMDGSVSRLWPCMGLLIPYAVIFYHTYFEKYHRFGSSVTNGFYAREDRAPHTAKQ